MLVKALMLIFAALFAASLFIENGPHLLVQP